MKYDSRLILKTTVPLLAFLYVLGCGSSSTPKLAEEADIQNPDNPFTDSFNNDFSQGIDDLLSSGDPVGGSGPNGNFTQQDSRALENLLDELEGVNPQDENELSPALQAEIRRVLEAESRGEDVSGLKFALAQKVMQQCAAGIGDYTVQPGETLIGEYAGSCNLGGKYGVRTVSMSIIPGGSGVSTLRAGRRGSSDTTNPGYSGGIYKGKLSFMVEGIIRKANNRSKRGSKKKRGRSVIPFSGSMTADQNGSGRLSFQTAERVRGKGVLIDQPQVARGKIVVDVQVKKDKTIPCAAEVGIVQPQNRAAERLIESIEKGGQCYRKALVFLSPMMDQMFKGMDPKIGLLLRLRMLGISN